MISSIHNVPKHMSAMSKIKGKIILQIMWHFWSILKTDLYVQIEMEKVFKIYWICRIHVTVLITILYGREYNSITSTNLFLAFVGILKSGQLVTIASIDIVY